MDIKKQLKNLPTTSGVYLFRDSKREILYIGKAVNLRNRVRSHFNNSKSWLNRVVKIETRPTNSEIAALILESQLIKKHRPPYNVQWKDDKNYFYVAVTQEAFPRIFVTHQPQSHQPKPEITTSPLAELGAPRNDNHITDIGPYIDGGALKMTLRILRKIFPYRSCKTMPRHPCLQYHLERCTGPCQIKNQKLLNKEYLRNIIAIIKVLSGKSSTLVNRFKKEMRGASTKQNFEQAAKIRDQITGLEKVLVHSQVIKPMLPLSLRGPRTFAKSAGDVAISKSVVVPNSGLPRFGLLALARNDNPWLKRVEAYDISNISGDLAVGSMIVFENGQPKKSDYRRFKIRTVRGANDIAMIKEVLQRRLQHHEWPWPDTILIDGGPAQLNTALEIIKGKLKTKNYLLKTRVYSLAKKQEKLYNTKNHSPIPLAKLKPEVGFLIQRIRNEAHRFALNYHRQLRKNNYYDPIYF